MSLPSERIVEGRDLVAAEQVRVHPDARPARRVIALDAAGAGPELVLGILGVDPELDRVAAQRHVGLAEAERLAGGDADLGGHHVEPGQHLGHRMLDLDPAVDLDEVEGARRVDEELERADVLVAGGDDGPQGALREIGPGGVGQGRRGRLLEDLLVPALDRAVALAHVDAVPVAVDRDLDLDVPVLVEPLLEVERIVAERGLGLGAADAHRGLELARRPDHAHALAAAARRRLDEHRIADPLGLAEGVHLVAEHPFRARDRRQAVGRQQLRACRPCWRTARGRRPAGR